MISLEYVDVLGDGERKFLEFSENLLQSPIKRDSLFVMQVDGKSMEPKIQNGSLVVVDLSCKIPKEDGIYIIVYDSKTWIKSFKSSTFISLNQDFSHLIYDASEVRIIAKVLLTFTQL